MSFAYSHRINSCKYQPDCYCYEKHVVIIIPVMLQELAWESEKKRLAVAKLRKHFLDDLEVEHIVLHAFRWACLPSTSSDAAIAAAVASHVQIVLSASIIHLFASLLLGCMQVCLCLCVLTPCCPLQLHKHDLAFTLLCVQLHYKFKTCLVVLFWHQSSHFLLHQEKL